MTTNLWLNLLDHYSQWFATGFIHVGFALPLIERLMAHKTS